MDQSADTICHRSIIFYLSASSILQFNSAYTIPLMDIGLYICIIHRPKQCVHYIASYRPTWSLGMGPYILIAIFVAIGRDPLARCYRAFVHVGAYSVIVDYDWMGCPTALINAYIIWSHIWCWIYCIQKIQDLCWRFRFVKQCPSMYSTTWSTEGFHTIKTRRYKIIVSLTFWTCILIMWLHLSIPLWKQFNTFFLWTSY